jgi:hypothetical protein
VFDTIEDVAEFLNKEQSIRWLNDALEPIKNMAL